jgi:RHS repeat-associated protein
VRSQTETTKRYRYTGKERDEESGLYYHGARYYATSIGRWASTDPIGVEAELELYSYGASNPIKMIDPTGNAPKRYEDQRGRDTAAKAREMKDNLEEAKKKGYVPDPMQKRAEDMAKKRGKTPIEQHHHKGVKQAAEAKLDPKKMGDPMSSVWSTKRDPIVQAGIGDEPVWDPNFKGKKRTPHNVAKELDLAEQKERPKTAKGLEDAAAASKWRLPDTADLSERAKMDWTPSMPKGPPVDPATGEVLKPVPKPEVKVQVPASVPVPTSKGKKGFSSVLKVAGERAAKFAPGVGDAMGAAAVADEASKGNYRLATLEAIAMSPTPLAPVADTALLVEAVGWEIKEVIDPEQNAEQWAHENLPSWFGF